MSTSEFQVETTFASLLYLIWKYYRIESNLNICWKMVIFQFYIIHVSLTLYLNNVISTFKQKIRI